MQKLALVIACLFAFACSRHDNAYDEHADAAAAIQQALIAAKAANKPLFVVFGANWCPDCQALSKALQNGSKAKKIADQFKVVKINVGNFDHNLDITKQYGNPIEGGIPGAVILSPANQIIYKFKPGELAVVRQKSESALYDFLNNKIQIN